MKKTIIMIIAFALLIIFLFPMVVMIYTSVIPQGGMTNVVTEYIVNDFEVNYMSYLRRSVLKIGDIQYSLLKESPETSQSLLVENQNNSQFGIKLVGTKDLRRMETLSFWLKPGNIKLENWLVKFEDIDGNSHSIPFSLEPNTSWQKILINKEEIDTDLVNLKYISGISIINNNVHNNAGINAFFDDIKVKNQYPTLLNYVIVWIEDMFGRYLLNSLVVSCSIVVGNLLFASMVAYAFARRHFKGKNILFTLVLATMMIPFQVTTIPIFILMKNLALLDTYFALILPKLVMPFSVFIIKQYIEQLPIEIEQAAYVDGANPFQVFFRIVLPLSSPALAVMGINAFIMTWNDLFMPLILTSSRTMRTAQVGLALYQQQSSQAWPNLMAATNIVGLPIIIAFLLFQKKIISGITSGSVKG
ncbi:MAG: carbohydrate ABC transporter permease [Kosmotogaceae bacterium]